MDTLTYGPWTLKVDRVATAAVYRNESPQMCRCQDCCNFYGGQEKAYPTSFRKLLDQLGIDEKKMAEIYHLYRDERGLHNYGGWYHFVGEVVDGPPPKKQLENGGVEIHTEEVDDDFSIAIRNKRDLTIFPDDLVDRILQLEFFLYMPWTLDEPYEE